MDEEMIYALVQTAVRQIFESMSDSEKLKLGRIAAEAINENRRAAGKPELEL